MNQVKCQSYIQILFFLFGVFTENKIFASEENLLERKPAPTRNFQKLETRPEITVRRVNSSSASYADQVSKAERREFNKLLNNKTTELTRHFSNETRASPGISVSNTNSQNTLIPPSEGFRGNKKKENNKRSGGSLKQDEPFHKKGNAEASSGSSVSNTNFKNPTRANEVRGNENEQQGNNRPTTGIFQEVETFPKKTNKMRLFMRRDNRIRITNYLPYPPRKFASQHLNYDGEMDWENSGYLSLFEYNPTSYKENSAITAINKINEEFVHYIFLPSENVKQESLIDNRSPTNKPHKDPNHVEKWTVNKAWGNNPSILLDTDNLQPPAKINPEDGTVIEYADRDIKEHLFVGRFPQGTLMFTEKNDDTLLLSWLRGQLPKGGYVKPTNMPSVDKILKDINENKYKGVIYTP